MSNAGDGAVVTAENYRINELARFRIIVGGLGASVCMSTFYGFNILSNMMMVTYGFSANDMTAITTTGIVVGFVTFPGGMLLDFAGPMYVNIMACTFNLLGALLFGLAFNGVISASVVTFAVFCAIMNLGCASFDTGSLMAVMGSFPLSKGSCVAIMKTLAGLGASCFAVIRYSFFRENYSGYMYFMCGVIVFCGALAITFIRFPPYHLVTLDRKCVAPETLLRRQLTQKAYLTQMPPLRRFLLGFTIIIVLLVYLTVQSLCVAYAPGMTDKKRLGVTIGVIIIVVSLPLVAAPFPFLGGMSEPYSKELPALPPSHGGHGGGLHPHDDHDGGADSADGEPLNEEKPAVVAAVAEEQRGGGGGGDGGVVLEDDLADDELGHVNTVGKEGEVLHKRGGGGGGDEEDSFHSDADAEVAVAAAHDSNKALVAYSTLHPQYQTVFWRSLLRPDIWLCWWNTLTTWGCGMVIAFNSAQIYRALADDMYEDSTNVLYSAIIGVGSAAGRMSMGIFETTLVRFNPDTRPTVTVVYPVASSCMVFGLIFLLALPARSKAIIIGFFFDSFGNGFSWASTALTVRTLFAKDIGKHYNFMYVGAFIAVICLNRFCYGQIYDDEAKRQRDSGRFNPAIYPRCSGKKCVQTSLIVLLCVNVTSIAGSILCHIRYTRFVRRERAKLREQLREQLHLEAAAGGIDNNSNSNNNNNNGSNDDSAEPYQEEMSSSSGAGRRRREA